MSSPRNLFALAALFSASLVTAQVYWDFNPPADNYTGELIDVKAVLGQDALTEADRVVVKGDEFVLKATGQPVRFWGVNIGSGSNTAEAAAFYAKRGVNSARYHSSKAIVDSNSNSYTLISSSRLDALHKAIANYSAEGIYVSLSEQFFPLSVTINPLWGIDGYDESYTGNRQPFWVLWFDEDLKGAYKGWLQQMLAATNPYNGLTIADDPAVSCIELVNEDNLFFWTFTPDNAPAAQWRKVERAMFQFIVAKYGAIEDAQAAWGPLGSRFSADDVADGRLVVLAAGKLNISVIKSYSANERKRVADQIEFLATTQREWFAEMTQVLRDSGFEGGVIASNWKTSDSDGPTSQSYLDDIEYWTYTAAGVLDHHRYYSPLRSVSASNGSVSPGDQYFAPPVVSEPRRLSVAVKQAEGHPTVVSELSWVSPSDYRAEASLFVGAYSGLNGVDSFYWFASDGPGWLQTSNLGRWPLNHPMGVGLFPAAAIMFRRGDVAPAPVLIREGKTMDSFRAAEPSLVKAIPGWDLSRDPNEFNFDPETGEGAIDSLSLLTGRIEIAYDTDEDFVHPDLLALMNAGEKVVESFTGQLKTDFAAGLLTVDTPMTQAIAGYLPNGGTVNLSDVRLDGNNPFGSLIVTSLDGLPIAQSSRLLIQSGTADRLTGWSTVPWYTSIGGVPVTGHEVETVGTSPWQVEQTNAKVIFKITDRAATRAVALDPNFNSKANLRVLTGSSGVTVTLPLDAIYTLVEFEPPSDLRPVIIDRALPNTRVGQSVSVQLKAASGNGPLTWTAASPLPAGLELSAEGLLSGALYSAGSYALGVQVADADGDFDQREIPIYAVPSSATSNPWDDLPAFNGWKLTDLGYVYDADWPFVYDLNFGWLYMARVDSAGFILAPLATDTGWIYAPNGNYPDAFYAYASQAWVFRN